MSNKQDEVNFYWHQSFTLQDSNTSSSGMFYIENPVFDKICINIVLPECSDKRKSLPWIDPAARLVQPPEYVWYGIRTKGDMMTNLNSEIFCIAQTI